MKKSILRNAIQATIVGTIYALLLRYLAGTNIVAGVFYPGPHLPHHYPLLIALFIVCRLYLVLLPGILLARLGYAWAKQRQRNGA
jgi:hypothetical protein